MLTHPDPTAQRLLLDAQAEIAEAKALKNLRLHERRLRRQFEKDKAELNELCNVRLQREEEEREQKRRRRERRQAQEAATSAAGGFEFANGATNLELPQEPFPDDPETRNIPTPLHRPEGQAEDADPSH